MRIIQVAILAMFLSTPMVGIAQDAFADLVAVCAKTGNEHVYVYTSDTPSTGTDLTERNTVDNTGWSEEQFVRLFQERSLYAVHCHKSLPTYSPLIPSYDRKLGGGDISAIVAMEYLYTHTRLRAGLSPGAPLRHFIVAYDNNGTNTVIEYGLGTQRIAYIRTLATRANRMWVPPNRSMFAQSRSHAGRTIISGKERAGLFLLGVKIGKEFYQNQLAHCDTQPTGPIACVPPQGTKLFEEALTHEPGFFMRQYPMSSE